MSSANTIKAILFLQAHCSIIVIHALDYCMVGIDRHARLDDNPYDKFLVGYGGDLWKRTYIRSLGGKKPAS